MKIIHQNGYSRDELLLFRLTIYKSELQPTPPSRRITTPPDSTVSPP